ncbi:MFS monosaccharide transporter [Lentinula raphanica]|nr:MFS monosaccharide transporter [Lentinula raphanica]
MMASRTSGYRELSDEEVVLPHGQIQITNADSDSLTYTYAYGPKGLAGLAHNRYVVLCAVFASIGGLSFGYDQGVIANVLVMKDFNARWPLTPFEEGLMTAVLELGGLIGALCAGMFADNVSRQSSILISCLIFTLGSLLQSLAQSLTHVFLGRAIGGIGVGALSTLSPLYISEISPAEVRGSLMALEQLAIVFGVVVGFWVGYFTREIPGSASWRIPLGVQLIPGIILIVGCIFLPASPRLLMLQGKPNEALTTLARLRFPDLPEAEAREDGLVQVEFVEMRVEATMILSAGTKHEWQTWKTLLRKPYRSRTVIGVLIAFFQQWSGINALLYYGPILIQTLQLPGDLSLLVSGGIGIVQFIAVLPVIAYIDQWGRRPLLRSGSIFMSSSHLTVALLINMFASDWRAHPIATWTSVGFIYIFTAAYGMSFGPLTWVLPSEVFPLSIRSKGVALSTASVWVNNFLVGLITPVALDVSPAGTFTLFATASFLAYLWVTYTVPETANVSLEDVDRRFAEFERSASGSGSGEIGRSERLLRAQIEEELGLKALIDKLVNGTINSQ